VQRVVCNAHAMKDHSTSNREDSPNGGYPSPAYAWYVVVVLTIAYTVSFIDRQIMALMVEPIRRDLAISDTQMSLLLGLAFAIFYTLLGIPIARLADRFSRRGIIAAGITIWCVMTATCGISRNYAQLFLARVGVGVGEAALSPSALSMMSDYFPKKKRGRAVAFYTMGISMGVGLAMILGGKIIALVTDAPVVDLPVLGELYAWQTVFLVVGLPGILVAALMLTVREPERKGRMSSEADATNDGHLSLAVVARFFAERWRMYGSHFFGMSTVGILSYGFFAWIPTMFIRTWGWEIVDIGTAYGAVVLIAGPLSIVLASWLPEYLMKRGAQDAHMRAALYLNLIGVICAILAPLLPTPMLSLAMLIPMTAGVLASTSAGIGALMIVTPNQMRAQSSALYYFVVNILGLTAGPTGIALFTDYIFQDEAMLRYSMASVAALAGFFGTGILAYNLRHYRMSLEESQVWDSSTS
jgi:MFS family permease